MLDDKAVTYTYDALHRRYTKWGTDESDYLRYDLDGRFVKATQTPNTNPFSSTFRVWIRQYDHAGRWTLDYRTKDGGLDGRSVAYENDAMGNAVVVWTPDNTYQPQYDSQNHMNDMVWTGHQNLFGTQFDGLNRPWIFGYTENGGFQDSLTYGNVNNCANGNGGGNGPDLQELFLSMGTSESPFTALDQHYCYNNAHQVVSLNTGYGGNAQDNAGAHPAASGFYNYTPNVANALTGVSGSSNASYTYDGNGYLISDGTRTYTYDQEGEGRIMTATVGGATWSYLYDPFGRRYAKTSPTGAVTLYLHDRDDNEVGEYDGVTGLTLRENRYDPQRVAPVVMLSYANGAGNGATPVLTFNHADRLGSVVATSSAPNSSSNAVLTGQYKYDAWGQSTTLIGTGFGYAGYRYDAETGLYHAGARYYDPRLGRFLSTDPLGQGPGLNVYAYVGNDPLNGVDPLGLATFQLGANGALSLWGVSLTGEAGVAVDLTWRHPQIGVYATGTVGKSVGADAGIAVAGTITPSADHITDLRGPAATFQAAAGAINQVGGIVSVSPNGTTSAGGSYGFGFGASGGAGFSGTKVGCVVNCPTGDNILTNVADVASAIANSVAAGQGNSLGGYAGPANPPTGPGK